MTFKDFRGSLPIDSKQVGNDEHRSHGLVLFNELQLVVGTQPDLTTYGLLDRNLC